ncbi:hypothetical protein Rhe02_67610 [Rhizocola hellebori]|uniref:RCK N-terminal domain-containing protein n=1 Tax=Rhizocola hellebori TaxID=1392758 RepID=A0A8J3VIR9_9ACTN|nr:NAD-binding protein [Rhizocola hellebori]GIH08694.1 hypothetical protein Rhe02_67610 [Rhizocola hellebori]
MSYSPSGPGQPRRINLLRLLFAAFGLAALICGYWGIAQLVAPHDPFGQQRWNILYADLQLFVLETPQVPDGSSLSPAMEFARFAAPMVTIYALVEASRLIFSTEVRRLRTRRARSHAIVCGQTVFAATIARRLRAAGERVVLVQQAEPFLTGRRRTLWVTGDPSDPLVLRAAGVRRASSLYACTHDSATNTAIALAAGRRRNPSRVPLRVYAQISDSDLCLTLQARYLGPAQTRGSRLDFFHADHVAARKLCLDRPLGDLISPTPPRVLVAGLTTFGRALVIELARYWTGRAMFPLPRLSLMLVDPLASAVLEQLSSRYPFLADVADFEVHNDDLSSLLTRGWPTEPPDRIFICDDDGEKALKSALIAEWLPPNLPREIAVRLDRLAGLHDVFEDSLGAQFDQLTSRLRIFGVVQEAADPDLIQQDLVERLARVVHDTYLRAELSNSDREDRASLRPWELLPESLRCANRAQAEDFGRKLRLIGCVLAPRVGTTPEHQLTEPEIELLAQDEHERWLASRTLQGWRHGPEPEEERRLHPGMVPWAEMPDQLRQPNYRAIRSMPGILAAAGFRIVRL